VGSVRELASLSLPQPSLSASTYASASERAYIPLQELKEPPKPRLWSPPVSAPPELTEPGAETEPGGTEGSVLALLSTLSSDECALWPLALLWGPVLPLERDELSRSGGGAAGICTALAPSFGGCTAWV
jgi:hypothetical protein